VAREREIGLESILNRGQPQLLQLRDRGLREPLIGEVRQRRAAPQLKSRAQRLGGALGVADRERVAALLDDRLEAVQI
jgi:hypothetical protein